MESIELGTYIGALRRELEEAIAAGEGEKLRFVPGNIELELQIGAQASDQGSGKISFKVFGIGAEGGGGVTRGSTTGQRIKLSLTLTKDGETPLIGAGAGASRN